MKRRLIAAALILAFPFGMAACGAQSKEAACKHIQKAAVSANKSAKIKGTSPDDIRDSLDQIIKTYKKANKKITNKKVKAAFTPLIEDLEKLRDATKSPGASTGGPDLMTDMSNHGKALNDLCGFDWGTGTLVRRLATRKSRLLSTMFSRISTSPLNSSGTTLPPPRRNTSRMSKTSTTTDRC